MKSKVLVTMTMQEAFSCHTIRQKSGIVDSVGPWVTMYAFGWTRLWGGEATYSFNQLMMSNCLNQIQLVNCVQDQDKKFLDLV